LNLSRNNLGHTIAAAGGGVLFLSLFFSWQSFGKASASAWDVFSAMDFVLAVVGLAAAAISVAHLRGQAARLPRLSSDAVKWLGVIAVTITVFYVLEADDADIGAILALLASLAILAGAVFTERPEMVDKLAAAAADHGVGAPGGAPIPPGPASSAPAAQPSPPGSAPTAAAQPTTVQPATAASADPSGPPAGWYPDPQGQARLRYWDGGAWTDQTSA
jgi:hypothetical protein